jgi:hypothetical protein
MCNPSCYVVLQGAKKVTIYSTGAPKTPLVQADEIALTF